jgi:hypothetical protein
MPSCVLDVEPVHDGCEDDVQQPGFRKRYTSNHVACCNSDVIISLTSQCVLHAVTKAQVPATEDKIQAMIQDVPTQPILLALQFVATLSPAACFMYPSVCLACLTYLCVSRSVLPVSLSCL